MALLRAASLGVTMVRWGKYLTGDICNMLSFPGKKSGGLFVCLGLFFICWGEACFCFINQKARSVGRECQGL